jgi:hypothetical protein
MSRVTSALVVAVLLGTAGVRLGCAWSCEPVTAATTHCHETSTAVLEFSAPATCNDVRSGEPLLVTVVRPDAATFASVDRLTSFSPATDDGVRSRPVASRPGHTPSPPAFAIPLRQ